MRALLSVILATSLLAGCDVANQAADTLARDQAKSVINGVVSDRFPGVNAAPITDCIIDNANAAEILSVAKASVTGVTDDTINTVITVAQRPETTSCIAKNGLSLLRL